MDSPRIVSQEEWEVAHEELLAKEKEATRARDALAAERRQQPMASIHKDYLFKGPDGTATLLDLFEGAASSSSTTSCSPRGSGLAFGRLPRLLDVRRPDRHPAHLHARDTSFALVSLAPLAQIRAYKERMGWAIPWFSSEASDFNVDFGVSTDEGETFGLSVFLRDGDSVFGTYFTAGRGVEALGSIWTFLDLTPLGRQEEWEDSPEGYPQTPPYEWWQRHDEYGA